MVNIKFQKEPYHYLFNLGIIAATLGMLLWLAFYFQLIALPVRSHGNLMFFSFLFSFVMGFLMTALPRMTQSELAKKYEIMISLALCSLQLFTAFEVSPLLSRYIFLLQLSFLFYFVASRYLKTRRIPFVSFIFLPFAFAVALFGTLWSLYYSSGDLKYFYILSGEAFLLNLICGVGARFIPVISRLPSALNPDQESGESKYTEFFIYALILNASYLLEFLEYVQMGHVLRLIVITIFAVMKFKIFQRPAQITHLGLGLKISIWGLFFGYLIVALNFGSYVAGMHIVYISGFSLITLMVASRIAIAYSQRSLNLEVVSVPILLTAMLLMVAAGLRFFAITGGTFFILAVIIYLAAIWCWKIFILKN